MNDIKKYTEEELFSMLDEEHHALVRSWLERGDGVAVYENVALDSANAGHKQFCSYGSVKAQIEDFAPPKQMPNIGSAINWRYMLAGVCRRPRDVKLPDHVTLAESAEDYFKSVCAFAKETDQVDSLQQQLDRLEQIAVNTRSSCRLFKDFSPQSFTFSMSNIGLHGGLIYHGRHDNGGDGSAPTFAVSLTPVQGWSIHT